MNCPKCGGLLVLGNDNGPCVSCRQCGLLRWLTLPPVEPPKEGRRAKKSDNRECPSQLAGRLVAELLAEGVTRARMAAALGVERELVTKWASGSKFPATKYLPGLKALAKEIA